MKTFLITIGIIVSFITITMQDKTTVKATYDGFENETYHFSHDTETAYVFDAINEETNKKYDLTNKKYIGQIFNITYTTETAIDEMDTKVEILTIVELEILQKW